MKDRELLEMAAKAAGIQVATWSNCQAGGFQSQESAGGKFWNPLTDDGDAMRLVVKLGLDVHSADEQYVFAGRNLEGSGLGYCECHAEDSLTATRRAITRAAAEIGRLM